MRTLSEMQSIAARDKAWRIVVQSRAVSESPAESKWSVPWRPRQFRRLTGRSVVAGRSEAPREVNRRFQWFRRYAQTHGWSGPLETAAASRNLVTIEEALRRHRRGYWRGVGRLPKPSPDWLVVSPSVVRSQDLRFAICDRERSLRVMDEASSETVVVRRLASEGPFEVLEMETVPGGGP